MPSAGAPLPHHSTRDGVRARSGSLEGTGTCPSPRSDPDWIPVRIAVVGAGAMGSVYAGLLADAGNDVWVVDTWEAHVAAIREHGLRVEGASGDRTVRLGATTRAAEVGEVDLIVVATKAMDVRAASTAATVLAGPETVVLPIQNGLGSADTVAEIFGPERTVVGVAGGFGASVVAPGHVRHEGMELLRLGEREGPCVGAARAHSCGLARGRVQREDLRRCRPARLGEAHLQRVLQRDLCDSRPDDRRGARRCKRVGGCLAVCLRGVRRRPGASDRSLVRRPGRVRPDIRSPDPAGPPVAPSRSEGRASL